MRAARHILAICCLHCGFFAAVSAEGAVAVSIDKSTTYQKIDGFGAFNAIKAWTYKDGPFYVPVDLTDFYNELVDDFGMSMIRTNVPVPCGDKPAENTFVLDADAKSSWLHITRLREIADARGETFRVIASCWSPPAWMKINNNCASPGGNNFLDPKNFEAFGNYLVSFLRTIKNEYGIEIYAISPQNEPAFDQPYSSCNYYNGDNYAKMLEVVGPIIKNSGLNTKIFGVEHMAWAYPNWESAIDNNATADKTLDFHAVHGYKDGVAPDPGSFDRITAGKQPLWMTETTNFGDDYAAGMKAAKTVLTALTKGNFSAWVFWKLMGAHTSYGYEFLVHEDNGNKTPTFYTVGQIYRFVRPGMVRIKASCSDGDLMVGAFKDDSRKSLGIVLVNSSSSAKTVTLNISGGETPPSFEMITTASGALRKKQADVSASDQITVPGNGIASLGYKHRGGNPTATALPMPAVAPRAAEAFVPTTMAVFDLNGRLVCKLDVAGIRALSRVWNGYDRQGRAVARGTYHTVLVDSRGRTRTGPALSMH